MTERLDYNTLTPAGMKALAGVHGHLLRSGLSRTLLGLVFLRASQINGCAFCIDMHSRELMHDGVALEKLLLVPVWREAGALFDDAERAALAWTESVTRIADTGAPDADYATASAVFAPAQLADLTIAIGLINAYNRLAISFRTTPKAAA